MLQRLAAWSYRRRRRVLVLWIVALIAVSAIGSSVGSTFSQGFSLSGTESQRAANLLESRFPSRAGDEGQIVFARAAGTSDPTVEARMEALFADVAKVPGVSAVVSPYAAAGARQVSSDGTVAYATVQFDRRAAAVPTRTLDAIRALTDATARQVHGIRIALGGRMFQERGGIGPAELIGILAAIVILLVAFGSLLAMGLPILVALFGIGIGIGFVELLSHVIVTPDFATQLASMIGIGVGIDYALFIVTRYRQALTEGLDPERAVVRAIDTAGRAVVFAGCTVVISILGLFLMGVDFMNGLAVGTSVTVAIVMLASITLLPAILGFAGRTIDRFSVRRRGADERRPERRMWFRWSRVIQRRPWPAFAAGLAILVVLAIPLFSMRLAFPDAGGNPTADTTRRAYDLVTDGFGAGFNGPLVLAAKFPEGADISALDRLVAALRDTPDVVAATPPTVNAAADAAVIRVIPGSSPQSQRTTDLVNTLRDDVIPSALRGSPVQVHVGGLTASSIDVSERLAARLPVFIGAVLVLSFLLLMTVFRSLLVPLKAVIMNLLSIGAAYGVVVAVFQWGWFDNVIGVEKTGPIAPFVPVMMFAILFGLSMDYEVFLLSRIREEYDRTHDNALAVADGLASTARVITAAALIMVTVFGSFMLADATTIKLFGLGLATAILVDRDGRTDGAGPGDHGAVGRPQLVVPALARPTHPTRARGGRIRHRRRARPPRREGRSRAAALAELSAIAVRSPEPHRRAHELDCPAVARVIPDWAVEPVVRVLAGAIDVDGGPTDEQFAVLRAFVSGYWGRTDLDVDTVAPIDPASPAPRSPTRLTGAASRELMVMLELCRHALSEAQVATRRGVRGGARRPYRPTSRCACTLVTGGAEAAAADYGRFVEGRTADLEEATLRARTDWDEAADEELGTRLRALHDLPAGTLGYEYVEFYRCNGIDLPGEDPNSPALFVAHDMCYVIAGYEPTGQGEIALGAYPARGRRHRRALAQLSSATSSVHEAGFLTAVSVCPEVGDTAALCAFDRLYVVEAFRRGAACTADFTTADHLAMVEVPLADVRDRFGIPPLDN